MVAPSYSSAGWGRKRTAMDRSMNFCRSKVAEYTRRAEETTDREMRDYFRRLRDNWIRVARTAETMDHSDQW
jgi:hypothetical protein